MNSSHDSSRLKNRAGDRGGAPFDVGEQSPPDERADGVGHGEARDRAQQREQHPLDHEQPRHPGARGAQRKADGDLAPAAQRAREQQVGDVGAGDEQHERDHSGQREQRLGEPGSQSREAAGEGLDNERVCEHVLAPLRIGERAAELDDARMIGGDQGGHGLGTAGARQARDEVQPREQVL